MKIDSDKVVKFLGEKWKGQGCIFCGGKEWTIGNKIFELREFEKGNLVLGGGESIVPIIPVTCNNCGNTILVNALVAKLVEE